VKTIGLLGGMSWESSALYYQLLNDMVRDRLGGLHSARCLLLSVDFSEIERLQVAGDWAGAGEMLAADAKKLESAGAELTVPLHIGDVTADAVRAAGLGRVGLLATAYTMEQPFLTDRLAARGLHVLVPVPVDRAMVHRVIYEELCLGIVREESRAAYQAVIERLVAEGAEGVILGCTEIELLVSQADVDVPVFPTTRLHVEAAVAAALA
jgi:aspartate racemase